MAEAKKNTKTEIVVTGVTLTMTLEEAEAVCTVLGRHPSGKGPNTMPVFSALLDAGVACGT